MSGMGKATSILLFVFFLGIVSSADLSISPTSRQVIVGETFLVNVTINDIVDLYSYQFDLTYDPVILKYNSISVGPFLSSDGATVFPVMPNTGVLGLLDNFAATRFNVLNGISGSGLVAVMNFTALSAGTSNLVILNDVLYDSNETSPQLISHTTNSGNVIVTSGTTCTDADGDGYGVCPDCGVSAGCTYDGNDCNDNPGSGFNINPGAIENCLDGIDNNCNGESDYDLGADGLKGDSVCNISFNPPGILSISPTTPFVQENTYFLVGCFMNPIGSIFDSVYVNFGGTPCSFVNYFMLTQRFNCSSGPYTGSNKTATCYINTSRSYVTGATSASIEYSISQGCVDSDGDTFDNCDLGTPGDDGKPIDCDDGNPSVYPGATEVCNEIDDNCNVAVDEGVQTTFYQDVDNDDYGLEFSTTLACSEPPGYASVPGDCNDGNSAINPGATEVCNGFDDNCIGGIDENGVCGTTTYYCDNDIDTFFDSTPDGSCDTYQCIPGGCLAVQGNDCDDLNPLVHPGMAEVCNGIDDDCTGGIDNGVQTVYYFDGDDDNFGIIGTTTLACSEPPNYASVPGDCDDGDPLVNPGATEACNGFDDNCIGGIDENSVCGTTTYYCDNDIDTFVSSAISGSCDWFDCIPLNCQSSPGNDCNDANPFIYPGATETCNLLDDNCNGNIDEGVQTTFYLDADNDDYGNSSSPALSCNQPVGYTLDSSDCDDSNPNVHPNQLEVCNGMDDNCNAGIDEGGVCGLNSYYCDSDNDTYTSAIPSGSCDTFNCIPSGCTSTQGNDCNDGNSAVYPNAVELCNEIDDNCNVAVDEGVQTTFYLDADNDDYGVLETTTPACSEPSGYASVPGDCNDGDPLINPGATEVCFDGIDNNCVGGIDEGCGGGCTITDLSWSINSVNEDDVVDLIVTGTNCDGTAVNLTVWERDGFVDDAIGGGDDAVNRNPDSVVFAGGIATGHWQAEWQDDGFIGIAGDPEYYFEANINGTTYNSGYSESDLLYVNLTGRNYEVINISLHAGKNAFSLPLILDDMSIDNVFEDIAPNVDKIYTYEGNFKIRHFNNNRPGNLENLETGRGYIIFMNAPATLTINGTTRDEDLQRPTIHLARGWNLIGTFSGAYRASDILRGVSYSDLHVYNDLTGKFEPLAGDPVLEREKSYWIKVTTETNFIPLTGEVVENENE